MLRCFCLLVLAGCGAAVPPPLVGQAPHLDAPGRGRALAFAAEAAADGPLEVGDVLFDLDPVGFLRAAYWHASVDLFELEAAKKVSANGLDILLQSARTRKQQVQSPRAGDLVAITIADGSLFPAQVVAQDRETVTVRGWFANGPENATVARERLAFAWDPFR